MINITTAASVLPGLPMITCDDRFSSGEFVAGVAILHKLHPYGLALF